MLKWDEYDVQVELLEPLLGTVPKDREVYASYVRTKAPVDDPDEIAPDVEEKGWTGFYTDDSGRPVLMDYQLKGFLKEAGNTIKDQLKLKALKSRIDSEVFVFPRRIVLAEHVEELPLERPLRAMTAQGPRVSLMRSDVIPAGTRFTAHIKVMDGSRISTDVLLAILEYGELKGLGQWRNGSYGRFTSTLVAR